jgi:hypothetical protein
LRACVGDYLVNTSRLTHWFPAHVPLRPALPLHPYWLDVFGARKQHGLAARNSFLSASGRRMFSNAMLDALGLSS